MTFEIMRGGDWHEHSLAWSQNIAPGCRCPVYLFTMRSAHDKEMLSHSTATVT